VGLSGDLHEEHGHAPNRYAVLTAAERLNADTALAGRGVTIAFLDSGFFPHPDLLLVNGERWIEDPGNGAKEPDPYGGFDSVLRIEP
jgi:hypothetical protein